MGFKLIVSPRIAVEGLVLGVTCHWCGAGRGQCPYVADIFLCSQALALSVRSPSLPFPAPCCRLL